jgi:Na+/melibiose symporter-like transporter
MDELNKEKNIETLYKHRTFLDKTRVSVSLSFERYLLLYSSGSLYLSIFFTNSLKEDLIQKEWLCIGWTLLIISIVAMLLSMYFSVWAHEEAIVNIDMMIKNINNGKEPQSRKNRTSSIVSGFEVLGGAGFILGVSSLAYFYFSNI